ncbi:hypothetical protein FHT76_007677 [Rhizobium sp. BK176]|nr:hypothetical protein [Rhizobium sp. BK399]MCS4095956.1 hypothetical protein [Rhizobium sp. BK176]
MYPASDTMITSRTNMSSLLSAIRYILPIPKSYSQSGLASIALPNVSKIRDHCEAVMGACTACHRWKVNIYFAEPPAISDGNEFEGGDPGFLQTTPPLWPPTILPAEEDRKRLGLTAPLAIGLGSNNAVSV